MNSVGNLRKAKLSAAKKAMEFIADAEVIGVGTGSTVEVFISLLGESKSEWRGRVFTASSIDTALKLGDLGFKVLHPVSIEKLDVYVDGADEVDRELNMIKGGGAALTLEKIMTYYSDRRVFIVDYTKLVGYLGEKHPVPLDVQQQALNLVCRYLSKRGYKPKIRYATKGKYGPIISDVGGVIVDVYPQKRFDPLELERELTSLPGVIETGLFVGLADFVVVGYEERAEVLKRGR
ncbi:MAG: ribose-5-phosphate isomerase RpiA [Desulfurococcales archaeon]|nr:ribose-5-phosphate isomerase RpiA [Desulfurococcales archaeon]